MKTASDYRIHPFTAEYRVSAVERCFRERIAAETAHYTTLSLIVGALFFVAFSLTDLVSLGMGGNFAILLAARLVTGGLGLVAMVMVRRRPLRSTTGICISAVELVALAAFFLACFLRPSDAPLHDASMVVILLTYYLFIPNRFVLALGVSLIGTAGFIILLLTSLRPDPSTLTMLLLLILVANTFGALIAHRLSVMRRQEYRQLQAERETNRLLAHEITERRRLQEELSLMARTDPLTGLLNRRHYLDLSELTLKQAQRSGYPVAVIFMDVDNFKQINDTRGHAAGDEALRTVAAVCRDTLREADIIGRYGGEEFAFTLPHSDIDGAMRAAENLRTRLATATVPSPNGPFYFTVSIGVAAVRPGSDNIADALDVADNALYEGKNSGRNRVVAAGAPRLNEGPQRNSAK